MSVAAATLRSLPSMSLAKATTTVSWRRSRPPSKNLSAYLSTTQVVAAAVKDSRHDTRRLEWSYISSPGKSPLLGLTVGQAVARAADNYGDKEALVSLHQGVRKTFTQIHEESDRAAAGLLALGLKPGDRVGILGPNTYEWYLTMLTTAKAGLILVTVNPAYRHDELQYCLNKVGIKAIICHEKFKTSDYYGMLCDLAPELPTSRRGDLRSASLPHLKTVVMVSDKELDGTYRFKDILDAGDRYHERAVENLLNKLSFDDPCNIQFTSGTTGAPKAVILTHHTIVNNAHSVGKRARYHEKEHRICLPVPLYHCIGSLCGCIMAVVHGCTCVLPSPGFDPEAAVQAMQDEKITSCYGTPTIFLDILHAQRRRARDLSSMVTGFIGGAPCPKDLVEAIGIELNMREFVVFYGMTETGPVTFQGFPDDSPQLRSSTIGTPLEHMEVKVINEAGEVVRVGEEGELCVRGYTTFRGYWGDPENTQETMGLDGWLRTGDIAVLRADGYGEIKGRVKDMIIRGGENIYPAEVEQFLMTHPDIVEVQVFGVPDQRMGEAVTAWIKKREGDTTYLDQVSIQDWCRGKISHFKIPKHILFKDEFPRTVSGKNQKFLMREVTAAELNLL